MAYKKITYCLGGLPFDVDFGPIPGITNGDILYLTFTNPLIDGCYTVDEDAFTFTEIVNTTTPSFFDCVDCLTMSITPTPAPTSTPASTPPSTPNSTPASTPASTPPSTPASTSSPTPTPSLPTIFCGSGVTTGGYYFYTDCCGNSVDGTGANIIVSMDYTKPNNGITKLNVVATTTCPTPTQTQTPTNTPTNTNTPSVTPTQTYTPTTTVSQSPTPSNKPEYRPKNECDVFTLFDMGIRCQVLKTPSSNNTFDGILTMKVTGGTAPYSYYWSGGQRTQTLRNIPAGNYPITVVDYYGDYTANTICSIFAPSPTPTQTTTMTPTVTPSSVWPNLCLIVSYGTVSYGPFQFVISGSQNGKPQWTSGNMVLGWSTRNLRWEIQGWTSSTGLPVSTNPTNIPTSSWAIAGGTGTQPQISMTEGTCPAYLPLLTNVVVTNTSCSGTLNCNGSISVTTSGGIPPYTYSINNGASYQSSNVFNGLCENTYTVITNDSLGNTQTQVVILGFDSAPTSYSINASLDRIETISNNTRIAYWRVDVVPSITDGSIITFDLNISTNKTYNEPGVGFIGDDNVVFSNSTQKFPSATSSITSTTSRPFCSPYETTTISNTETYQLQISSGTTVSGTSTSILNIVNGVVGSNGCVTSVEQSILVSVSSAVVGGNSCSAVVDDETPQGITNHTLQFGGDAAPVSGDYTEVISGVGTSAQEACAEFGFTPIRYVNGPEFRTGLNLYEGNPLYPTLVTGFSYCTDGSGQIYLLNNGKIGKMQPYSCSNLISS